MGDRRRVQTASDPGTLLLAKEPPAAWPLVRQARNGHRHGTSPGQRRPHGDPDARWERSIRPPPCRPGRRAPGRPAGLSTLESHRARGGWSLGGALITTCCPGRGGRPDKRAARMRGRRGLRRPRGRRGPSLRGSSTRHLPPAHVTHVTAGIKAVARSSQTRPRGVPAGPRPRGPSPTATAMTRTAAHEAEMWRLNPALQGPRWKAAMCEMVFVRSLKETNGLAGCRKSQAFREDGGPCF